MKYMIFALAGVALLIAGLYTFMPSRRPAIDAAMDKAVNKAQELGSKAKDKIDEYRDGDKPAEAQK